MSTKATLKASTDTVTLNTGAKIPLFGLGTWQSTDDDASSAVAAALKHGYKHIDTASFYKNEELVGKAVKESGIPREELFITTKVWNDQQRDPAGALDLSLKKLGTEYVDLLLMHWPVPFKEPENSTLDAYKVPRGPDGKVTRDEEWDFVKTWHLMQKLLGTGKVKAIGVSNFSINNLEELLNAEGTTVVPAVNQVELHIRLPQLELVEYCQKKGIVVEAYSPLGSSSAPLLKDATVNKVAEKYGVTPAHVLLNYVANRGIVVLPKSVKESRIISNFEYFKMDEEDIKLLNDIHKKEGVQRFVDPDFSPFPLFQ
ncbi:AER401Wp [Eremothecium gossypii ATCC 10895]|uniref:AER401Wp n=1 Tax=Eremothecium gossypii (strain ATCC 10895 / CBS 109.51 / FGSC 9923 / NRRL Y-1056) TaxID=284811 RepID=Q755W7_EREGS|nr:AER401Wp [Eremothecium gossypii ATCC 10895]AAS53080.1 AER401Wp [Eremothecium gossypii ATCC 10895]